MCTGPRWVGKKQRFGYSPRRPKQHTSLRLQPGFPVFSPLPASQQGRPEHCGPDLAAALGW